MLDVIVVGAGPAGSAAAKRCAEYGLNTMILEKHILPREKVCDGMVMGPAAHTLIKQEFGDIPKNILSDPYYLSGYIFHTPGIGSRKLDNFTPVGWRKDLDYWMSQKAQAKGVEIWQGARVTALRRKGQGFSVEIEKDKETKELESRFVVGADGVSSIVRRFIRPELKVGCDLAYQESYRGELDLDRNYYHWFYPVEPGSSMFTIQFRDDFFILGTGGESSQAKQNTRWVKDLLAKNYHFDINQKPFWRDGCLTPITCQPIPQPFLPAKGNILLTGDAGGFILPVSGEGIGVAIKSGLLAANSIMKAIESAKQPDRIYLAEIKGMLSVFSEIYPWCERIAEEMGSGGHSLPEVLRDAYRSTLRMF